MTESAQLVVSLDNVYITSGAGVPVFQNLCFALEAGKNAFIVGGAGSGKTSLVELITGLRFAESGSVEVFGENLRLRPRAINRVRRKIGGVGGLFDLMPSMTVAENIVFPLILTGAPKARRQERLLKMLSEFSLMKKASEYMDSLTRVERTLVLFARATIANQPLVILDEPAAGLDQATSARIFEYLVKVSLSGRSLIILNSDAQTHELPNSSYYEISNGALQ